jgi:DNA-binding MarR family transcriptional regulator
MADFEDSKHVCAVREFLADVGKRLSRCAEQNQKRCSEQLDAGKISSQEFALLLALTEHGTMAVKDIAARLSGISLSTLTRMLDKLEENGFVTRALDPEDRRSFLISGTGKAIQAADAYTRQMDCVASSMLEALEPSERELLIGMIGKIRARLRTE